MGPRKGVKTQDVEISDPTEPADGGLEDLLLSKIIEQLDIPALALKLAPELANGILSRISLDCLRDKVLYQLANRIAEEPALFEAISSQIMSQLKQ